VWAAGGAGGDAAVVDVVAGRDAGVTLVAKGTARVVGADGCTASLRVGNVASAPVAEARGGVLETPAGNVRIECGGGASDMAFAPGQTAPLEGPDR